MGRLHPLRHLDVPQTASRQPCSYTTPSHAPRNTQAFSVAALLTLAAASNLIDVYGLVAILGPRRHSSHHHRIPRGARRSRFPCCRLWWQMLFMARRATGCRPGSCSSTTPPSHTVVPTLRTLTQGWTRMLGSFKFILSVEPPTGTGGRLRCLPYGPSACGPRCSPAFSQLTEDGRFTMIAIIPVIANLAICALLGSSSGYLPHIRSAPTMALVLVIWISARWKLLELGRWISSIDNRGCLHRHVAIGGCLGRRSGPHHSARPLRSAAQPVRLHKPVERHAFVHQKPARTTCSSPSKTCPQDRAVRLAVMDRFDGNVWNLSDSTMSSDSSNYHRVGDLHHQQRRRQEIHREHSPSNKGLSDYWLPIAGAASSVTFDTSVENVDSFYYNSDTMSAIYPSRTSPKASPTRKPASCQRIPTDKQITKANAASISQPKAEDAPDCVDKLATAIAGGQSKGGEAAQAHRRKTQGIRLVLPRLERRLPVQRRPRQLPYRPAARRHVRWSETASNTPPRWRLWHAAWDLPSRVVLGFLPKRRRGRDQRQPHREAWENHRHRNSPATM